MNTEEARKVLAHYLEHFRAMSYSELAQRVGQLHTTEEAGDSGQQYQIEVQFIWDGPTQGAVRVFGTIDDGGWRAFAPLGDDFLMGPDGRVVG